MSEEVQSAGVTFTNGSYILGGYQKNGIGGIGGKRNDEDPFIEYTAMRECLEELFEFSDQTIRILVPILLREVPCKVVQLPESKYTTLVYTFTELEKILLFTQIYKSPLYDQQPRDILDLVFNRKPEFAHEITYLTLLPVVKHHSIGIPFVNPYFIWDMKSL